MLHFAGKCTGGGKFKSKCGGLCEHHTEHNADCGYTEGIEGTPCNHEHTEDCYTLVTECVHKHTEDCYPAESVSDNTPPRPMRKIGGR